MTLKIIYFYIILFSILWLLKFYYKSKISTIAFTWLSPFPVQDEYLAKFKLRQLIYAFSWLLQLFFIAAVLFLLAVFNESIEGTNMWLVFMFGTSIGLVMATLATIYYFFSWLKTVIIGPNPQCEIILVEEESG